MPSYASSYPSVFGLVGIFPSGSVASHSFHYAKGLIIGFFIDIVIVRNYKASDDTGMVVMIHVAGLNKFCIMQHRFM